MLPFSSLFNFEIMRSQVYLMHGTQGSAMNIIDLRRRQPGPRAEQLLDRLQAAVEKGAARCLDLDRARALERRPKLEDARSTVSGRAGPSSATIGRDHIAIL